MSAANDEIRRALGCDMPGPPQSMADMVFSVRHVPPAIDPRKRADEQCQGVDADLLHGIVLGMGDPGSDQGDMDGEFQKWLGPALQFHDKSFDLYEPTAPDTEGGSID
jgi:hypothetical protein